MSDVNTNYDQADDNAKQVIRHTKQVTRRQFSPEEKVRIVIEGIRGEIGQPGSSGMSSHTSG